MHWLTMIFRNFMLYVSTLPNDFHSYFYRKGGIAVGLPLCHEDCMALRNHYCFKDWALIEDNKRRNVFIKSRGHFRLPKCEDLPKHSNTTKTCTKSSITTMRWDLATSKIFFLIFLFQLIFCSFSRGVGEK